ncbi:hypothetical protein ebA6899 [Aromatoleum aromaticum EbN1]|uniref:Uncharacterized protein n=1 Tax=Aromatoleum aromaticum (strain DSM 19018 / LMG 30748 / EbN1) TaxID=76114 RepID=Q5NY05_AROAE|nr:hypothetical protein ebA6899 [Aromatoleum aromaticum EbN1]
MNVIGHAVCYPASTPAALPWQRLRQISQRRIQNGKYDTGHARRGFTGHSWRGRREGGAEDRAIHEHRS